MAEQLVEVPVVSPSNGVVNVLVPQMGVEAPKVVSQPAAFFLSSRPSTFQFLVVWATEQWEGLQNFLLGQGQCVVEQFFKVPPRAGFKPLEVVKALFQDRVQQLVVEVFHGFHEEMEMQVVPQSCVRAAVGFLWGLLVEDRYI